VFIMRFDMRAPGHDAAARAELYATAIEMAKWGESRGCLQAVVSEHHGSADGYLPSPLILASAMAAATQSLPIQVAALIVPLHDPIRLAEDMAVLDTLSRGRVSYVTAVGYVKSEYEMMGRPFKGRGRRMDASLAAIKQAWAGEPFEYDDRPVRVAPRPFTPGGPTLFMGGNSAAAVRRAARFGMGLIAQGGDPSLEAIYKEACAEFEQTPGLCIIPPEGAVMSAFVAEDVDQAWSEIGPHLLHDAQAYARWMGEANLSATKSTATSVDELRAEQGNYRIFTPGEAVAHMEATGPLLLQPLCGGLSPDLAWPSLELIVSEVLPGYAAAIAKNQPSN
jgi:alkanesulfonate monooxygenase SsuD/methylene tetrahydromethanopterin reductase-like flavin-dependent oxidoreductase (luciferase family)